MLFGSRFWGRKAVCGLKRRETLQPQSRAFKERISKEIRVNYLVLRTADKSFRHAVEDRIFPRKFLYTKIINSLCEIGAVY